MVKSTINDHFSICWIFHNASLFAKREAEETHAAIRAFMAKAVSEEVAEKAPKLVGWLS